MIKNVNLIRTFLLRNYLLLTAFLCCGAALGMYLDNLQREELVRINAAFTYPENKLCSGQCGEEVWEEALNQYLFDLGIINNIHLSFRPNGRIVNISIDNLKADLIQKGYIFLENLADQRQNKNICSLLKSLVLKSAEERLDYLASENDALSSAYKQVGWYSASPVSVSRKIDLLVDIQRNEQQMLEIKKEIAVRNQQKKEELCVLDLTSEIINLKKHTRRTLPRSLTLGYLFLLGGIMIAVARDQEKYGSLS